MLDKLTLLVEQELLTLTLVERAVLMLAERGLQAGLELPAE